MKNTITLLIVLVSLSAFGEEDKRPTIFFSDEWLSSQVAKDGYVGYDGPVNQATLAFNYEKLSAWYVHYYILDQTETNEHDFGLQLALPKVWILEPYINVQHWKFSSNDYDNLVTVGIDYHGIVDSKIEFGKLCTNGFSSDRSRIFAEVSKEFQLGTVKIRPSIRLAGLDNFYDVTGLGYVTGGVKVSYPVGKHASIYGTYNIQKGFEQESHSYGGIGVSLSF